MARGKASGFVFAIKDPRLPKDKDIIYVGNGRRPWESVERHLTGSSNSELFEWSQGLLRDFPEGPVIYREVICDLWLGEEVTLPPIANGRKLIEWVILDFEEDTGYDPNDPIAVIVPLGTKKKYWIDKLRAEGQPLLNRASGRPQGARGRKNSA